MRKVYFNERFIGFTNLSDNALLEGVEQIVVTGHKDIPNLLKYFDDSPHISSLILKSADEHDLFNAFVHRFKHINAAGGVVKNAYGDVLLINRFEKWDLPKGKVEKDEYFEDAAVREVEEECGLSNVELGEFITCTYHVYTFREHRILKTTYWYSMKYHGDEVLVPQLMEDIVDATWVRPEVLDEYLAATYGTIKDVFRRCIGKELIRGCSL